MKVYWKVCILQSLMNAFDVSKVPHKEQLRRVVFWVMQLKFTHIPLGLDEKIERESSKLKLGSNANLEENEVVEHNTTDEMLGLSNHMSVLNPRC
ncbi:hypothetical protein CFP56_003304, partial [Quercus suber]